MQTESYRQASPPSFTKKFGDIYARKNNAHRFLQDWRNRFRWRSCFFWIFNFAHLIELEKDSWNISSQYLHSYITSTINILEMTMLSFFTSSTFYTNNTNLSRKRSLDSDGKPGWPLSPVISNSKDLVGVGE